MYYEKPKITISSTADFIKTESMDLNCFGGKVGLYVSNDNADSKISGLIAARKNTCYSGQIGVVLGTTKN